MLLSEFCFSLRPSEMLCWKYYKSKKYSLKLMAMVFLLVKVVIFPIAMEFLCKIITVGLKLAFSF